MFEKNKKLFGLLALLSLSQPAMSGGDPKDKFSDSDSDLSDSEKEIKKLGIYLKDRVETAREGLGVEGAFTYSIASLKARLEQKKQERAGAVPPHNTPQIDPELDEIDPELDGSLSDLSISKKDDKK